MGVSSEEMPREWPEAGKAGAFQEGLILPCRPLSIGKLYARLFSSARFG
jgi:hypothetical protein